MFVQFLAPMLIFISLTLLSIAYPRIGGILHALIGLSLGLFLFGWDDAVPMLLIILPLVLLGILYWFGRPQPRRLAYRIAVGLPLVTLVVCGIEPVVRLSTRVDDGIVGERTIEGNGVRLVWAAEGNGWPRDGKTLADIPQNVWRLPTVEEAVRSMARHRANSGGVWNAQTGAETYRVRPDKESPLWNPHSQVIYWRTATEIDTESAYIVVYNGKAWPRRKRFAPGSLGYRCVRMP